MAALESRVRSFGSCNPFSNAISRESHRLNTDPPRDETVAVNCGKKVPMRGKKRNYQSVGRARFKPLPFLRSLPFDSDCLHRTCNSGKASLFSSGFTWPTLTEIMTAPANGETIQQYAQRHVCSISIHILSWTTHFSPPCPIDGLRAPYVCLQLLNPGLRD